MSNAKNLTKSALASMIAVGVMAASTDALAGKPGFEKCQGVAKAGMNDCGTRRLKTLIQKNGYMFQKVPALKLLMVK
jgi:uncharacterized membrane protein